MYAFKSLKKLFGLSIIIVAFWHYSKYNYSLNIDAQMSGDNFIVNPNNNLEIPEWVNKEYFQKILLQDEPKYESVLNFTPVAAIPPGENFTSIMIRIYIELAMKGIAIREFHYNKYKCLTIP